MLLSPAVQLWSCLDRHLHAPAVAGCQLRGPFKLDLRALSSSAAAGLIGGAWAQLRSVGVEPTARLWHTGVVLAESVGEMLAFGGRGRDGAYRDDLWQYFLAGGSWASAASSG